VANDKKLEEIWNADNTIVIYYADHGGLYLASSKDMNENRTHVPLLCASLKNIKNSGLQGGPIQKVRPLSLV